MKIKFEYPLPVWCNRGPDEWHDIQMYDISFDTKIHYFKNHENGYTQLVVTLFGFGIRISSDI